MGFGSALLLQGMGFGKLVALVTRFRLNLVGKIQLSIHGRVCFDCSVSSAHKDIGICIITLTIQAILLIENRGLLEDRHKELHHANGIIKAKIFENPTEFMPE
jgi:hypothetical protein